MRELLNSWSPRILSVLRIITGFLFLWHGTQKLFSFPPPPGMKGPVTAFMIFAGILELGGGTLILLGLFTRWTAFILSGMMAVAYFIAHAAGNFFPHFQQSSGSFAQKLFDSLPEFLPLVNKGELAVIYCFVFFYFFFAGGGAWSLDNLIEKKA